MIPFFQINSIVSGPITIQAWGLFVALGMLIGLLAAQYLARRYLLSSQVILDVGLWAIIGGLVGGRLFFVWFYALDYYLTNPLDILKFWQGGASSLGGFIGALVAVWLFIKRRHFSWQEFLPYLDMSSVGLWLGWGIGRVGCFLIHDHPGRLTNFSLAVNFPNGMRHDLGLYESIFSFFIFIIFALLFKKLVKIGWGLVTGFSFGLYAVGRFFLDFLRATDLDYSDAKYFYLTPAQWGMLVIMLTLTFWVIFAKIKRVKNS